ncbi:MAG TPA: glycosyltransferase family A protein [Caulobacteraceae bacterium]|jgi:glycosyltransferase involved in cell wall biosynthesis
MTSVDVVIPCYNYGRYLQSCVDSVLSQKGVDVRVLCIDDASSDDTPQVAAALAARDGRVAWRRHAVNHGHIATFNEGLLEWASASYSLLLSADDYLLPGALAQATRLMEAEPAVGFTFGSAVLLRPGEPAPVLECGGQEPGRVMTGAEFVEMSGSRDLVPTATAVVRTALQQRIGGYRPELPHAGDMEMWLRFAAYAGVGMFATPQAVRRLHDTNMSLAYLIPHKVVLPDLQQRAAVFATFFAGPATRLGDLSRLRVRTVGALAEEAVWEAHFAFEAGEIDACREIAEFATDIYPRVRFSRPWATLALKRLLGSRAWAAIAPTAAAMRSWPGWRPRSGPGTHPDPIGIKR